jgi:hypothetical protein
MTSPHNCRATADAGSIARVSPRDKFSCATASARPLEPDPLDPGPLDQWGEAELLEVSHSRVFRRASHWLKPKITSSMTRFPAIQRYHDHALWDRAGLRGGCVILAKAEVRVVTFKLLLYSYAWYYPERTGKYSG